jgi:hypothetical protein
LHLVDLLAAAGAGAGAAAAAAHLNVLMASFSSCWRYSCAARDVYCRHQKQTVALMVFELLLLQLLLLHLCAMLMLHGYANYMKRVLNCIEHKKPAQQCTKQALAVNTI